MNRFDTWSREVKIFYVVPFAQGVSGSEFEGAWRKTRTPDFRGLRRYVLITPMSQPGGDDAREATTWCFGQPLNAGVAELWFDRLEDWVVSERNFANALAEDLGRAADLSKAQWFATREHPVIVGPEMSRQDARVKALFFPTRLPGMTLGNFQKYWRTKHGEIVSSRPGTPHLMRYIQCMVLPETYADAHNPDSTSPAKNHANALPNDGIAELWWLNAQEMQEALAAPAFKKVQPEDALNFVDPATLFGFVGTEDRRIWD